MLITNIDYTVEIAEKDRTWISGETSRTDQREESLVFSFRPNSDVKSRQATVRLVDSEGNLLTVSVLHRLLWALSTSDLNVPMSGLR